MRDGEGEEESPDVAASALSFGSDGHDLGLGSPRLNFPGGNGRTLIRCLQLLIPTLTSYSFYSRSCLLLALEEQAEVSKGSFPI